MPSPPQVLPDLPFQRACRLLEAIRAAVPTCGAGFDYIEARVARVVSDGGYSRREYRAAVKALKDNGAITTKGGIYRRGSMF